MKYELGDKVRIRAHWRKADYSSQLENKGIKDLEEHLVSDDMAGDYIRLRKNEKVAIDEVGLVVGTRQIKTEYDLMLEYDAWDGPLSEPYIYQIDSKHERVYLVATRMNCMRRVSFEDIEYVGGD